ncbi:extracellular solute-binding protein [Thermobrachium celere]|uniref:Sugar ABC transporter substrate-binding protein n=1 Tax=Thermobrachium celere DSM 8682 TaxID=941824 RepID=R7RUP3_9CLOT|nr:ABC transporter substrate-binding protein [Thermobrachium celere]CDF59173.1 sugar ABC transporter substrate-binding protein [Thermobrachium celere DSM 8682]
MKMKKYLSILLSTVVVATSLVGCGPKTGEKSKTLEVKKDKVLRVWSFTDELKKPLEYFEKKYGIKTELTIIPTENYASKIQPVLESGVGAPDVFTAEIAWLKQWTDLPYWENLSEDPYNADEWEKDYVPYVFNLGKDSKGNVKALSWQATPGGFIYKRWIARKVWGNDDPAFVAEKLSTMENFLKAAEELKKAGYKILPDEGALRWFAKGSDPKPWVNEKNELQLTQAQIDFMDYQKKLRDNEYTAMAPEWSPAWFASMQGPVPVNAGWEKDINKVKGNKTEVFGYVMPTWGLHYVIKPNAKNTAGDWGLTNGPSPYFWGGTWIGIYSGSDNKGAAWEFVKMMTHDEEFLNWWYKETGDLLSYKPVTDKVKDSASDSFLKGQNHYQFFLKEADKINPNIVTKYDQGIDNIWGNVVSEYVNGKKTKEEAINEFYKQVKNAYPEIITPLDKK